MAPTDQPIPVVAAYRLAEYHCLLSEILKSGSTERLTSRMIAQYLNLSEEIVRKDLSFITEDVGTPGLGYDPVKLYKAISRVLHVDRSHDVCLIGNVATWRGIMNFFDPRKFGFNPRFIFSDVPSESGLMFDQVPVYSIEELPDVLPETGIKTAILACDLMWIKRAVTLLDQAGVKGILNLTPSVLDEVPEGMYISQVLLPCEIKLVVYHIEEGIVEQRPGRLKKDIGKRARLKRARSEDS